jgi:hypothetical protein
LEDEAHGEALVLRTDHAPLPSQGLIVGEINLKAVKSEPEYFFLGTVAEIDRKTNEGGKYNLITSAGLLRKLLMDSHPLIHMVNKTYRQKIEFEFVPFDYHPELPLSLDVELIDVDGTSFPGVKTIRGGLDVFLRTPCFRFEGITASVRDLIRACANAKGGVHLGVARTVEENRVIDWDRMFQSFGTEPSLIVVAGVCRVSLRGLLPLVGAITSTA